jgi:7-cyano-7-deazaguanine reductase
MEEEQVLEASPLGSDTQYVNQYDATLLYPIERALNWEKRGVDRAALPFRGVDLWNGYEISWLTPKGKPVARIAVFTIDAASTHIIESKSFKLYLNSYNLSRFDSDAVVKAQMEKDLTEAAGGQVTVDLYHPDEFTMPVTLNGVCLDELDIEVDQYTPDAGLLSVNSDEVASESLYSHLLKSNCPVTGQPDWASISIQYQGPAIDHAGLLKYLISYREHGDFHEQCVENIFMDIWEQCSPTQLTVYARYVRRGGLDINPYRSTEQGTVENTRLHRQ